MADKSRLEEGEAIMFIMYSTNIKSIDRFLARFLALASRYSLVGNRQIHVLIVLSVREGRRGSKQGLAADPWPWATRGRRFD